MSHSRAIPGQVRAARALLGWTIANLSEASGVSVRAIKYFENEDPEKDLKYLTISKLVNALEVAGIEFIGTLEDGPGIRLRPRG
jgi:transcriptional regulator with XRE-family HTH domain